MFLSLFDVNHRSPAYRYLDIVDHDHTFSIHESPDLRTVTMDLITDVLACLEGDGFRERLVAVTVSDVIYHAISSPSAFLIHRTAFKTVHMFLDELRAVFRAYQYAVRTGGYHNILETVAEDGKREFVDYMGIVILGTQM